MPSPLTPEERQALTTPGPGRGPLRLQDRIVEGLTVPAAALRGAVLHAVEFRRSTLEGVRLEDATLDQVTFRDCQLHGVAFRGCQVARTSLELCELRDVRLEGGRWDMAKWAGCRGQGVVVQDCAFRGLTDDRSEWKEGALRRVRFEKPAWSGARYARTAFEDVALEGGRAGDLRLSACTTRALAFRGLRLDEVAISMGQHSDLAFQEVEGTLGLGDAEVRGLRLASSALAGLSWSGLRAVGITIEGCRQVSSFHALHSRLERLRVVGSTMWALVFQDTEILGPSSIERSTVAGVELSKCRVDGLTLDDVTLEETWGVEGSRFRGLKLARVKTGQGYALEDAGAVFEGGDRLPRR